ncbi:MAG TPA: MaoC/PaaZ C-terminal domain-containing protein [Solirubrobacterales bacterium]|nr:MaoC/PaaZ C-terminal domain-containing protein [Solirubrobacterales bacterium]
MASGSTEVRDAPPSLLGLYARSVAGSLLPGRPGLLPTRRLALREVEVDVDHLARYARVCGYRLGSALPATYPHVLGFPLELELMSDRSFPFAVLGIVHVANRIEQLEPVRVDARPTVTVHAEGLRPHRRGTRFDLVTEVGLDGGVVWREHSTYLHPGDGDPDAPREPAPGEGAAGGEVVASWPVPGDIGRRYAAVSGDRNPIHIHALTAKPFGFGGAIAHGMWSKARCLAALEARLPDAYEAAVEFRSPLRIPTRARFRLGQADRGYRFALEPTSGSERPYLQGFAGRLGVRESVDHD